jgi:hypothetical protein
MRLRVALAVVAVAAVVPGAARAGGPQSLQPPVSPPTAVERAEATQAALRFARRVYAPRLHLLTLRSGAVDVQWARSWRPAQFLRSACGVAVWTRTLAVTVVFPVMYATPPRPFRGCDHCAGVVLLVSRGPAGWFVWDTL